MLNIRTVQREDLPALVQMERAAATAAHWKEAEYEMLLASDAAPLRKTFVAEEDGNPIGFVVAKLVRKDWEIENIVVRAGAQHRGIGRLLLTRLIQEAQACGAQQILLEVRSQNIAAKSVYTNCGFSVVGGRRGYYQDPADDAVLYKLELTRNEGSE